MNPTPAAAIESSRPGLRPIHWSLIVLVDLLLIASLPLAPYVLFGLLAVALLCWLSAHPNHALAFLLIGMPLLMPISELVGHDLYEFRPDLLLLLGAIGLIFWVRLWNIGRPVSEEESRDGNRGVGFVAVLLDPIFLASVGLAAVLWIGLFWTPAPHYGGGKLRGFVLQSLLLLLVVPSLLAGSSGGPEDRIERGFGFLRMVIWIEVAIGLIGIWNYFTRHYAFDDRLNILGINAIWTARYLGAGLLTALALGAARRMRPLLLYPVVGLLLVNFYLAGSRGPLIALVLSLLAWMLLTRRLSGVSRPMKATIALLGLVGLGILVLLVKLGSIPTPFSSHETANMVRMKLLEVVLEFASQTGWLGAGTGAFPQLVHLGDVRLYPHNIFFELWLENGAFGLLALLGFLAAVTLRSVRGHRLLLRGRTGKGDHLILYQLAIVQFLFAFLNAQFSGDLPVNSWIWLWAGALIAWAP